MSDRTVSELAGEMSRAFVSMEGGGYRLRDGSPDWMTEVVRCGHLGELPGDYMFELVQDAVGYIAEGYEIEDWDADSSNGKLVAWLAENWGRAAWVDEAETECGWPENGILQLLQIAQVFQWERCYGAVLQSLQDVSSDMETEEDS